MVSNGKPLKYFGGKGNLVYKLLQFIPEHKWKRKRKKRIECIWINYDIEKQKSLFGG